MGLVGWQPGLSAGTGYDKVSAEPKQVSVLGDLTAPDNAVGQEGDFNLLMCQTEEELNEALSIDADVSVGVGFVGGDAKFQFRDRCRTTTQSQCCVLRIKATNAHRQMKSPKLHPEAWSLIENGNMDRFRERFGDEFVSGMVTGVEFFGVVRIEARTEQREQEITASVQAQYGVFASGGAKVEHNFSMSSAEHRVEIFTYQKGGEIGICKELSNLFALAQAAVNDGRAGRAYPYQVMLDPYSELALPNDDASFIDVEAARNSVKRHAKNRDALRQMQNEIDFVLRHQDWFEDPNVARLNSANQLITAELETIAEYAKVCARNFAACQGYSPTYPEPNGLIPPRRPGAPSGESRKFNAMSWIARNPERLADLMREIR
jgi:hypothetical protein